MFYYVGSVSRYQLSKTHTNYSSVIISDMEVKDVQDCLGFNLGMDINAASMSTFTTNIKPKFCKKTKDGTTGKSDLIFFVLNLLELISRRPLVLNESQNI